MCLECDNISGKCLICKGKNRVPNMNCNCKEHFEKIP